MTRSAFFSCTTLIVALSLSSGCGDDGGIPDSAVARDTGAFDSAAGDSSVPTDSGASDSAAVDSSVPGDSGVSDSGDLDSAVLDSRVGDSGAGDSGIGDSGTPPDAGACVDPPPADRVTPITCSACRPTWPDPSSVSGPCTMHSDCTAGDNGRCVAGAFGTFCDYDECFDDGDCDADEVCSCDGSYVGGSNRCVPSNCRLGSDCTSGRCSPTDGCLLGGPPEGWFCRTAGDTCGVDADCNMDGGAGGRCAYDSSLGAWACAYGICVF